MLLGAEPNWVNVALSLVAEHTAIAMDLYTTELKGEEPVIDRR